MKNPICKLFLFIIHSGINSKKVNSKTDASEFRQERRVSRANPSRPSEGPRFPEPPIIQDSGRVSQYKRDEA